jgi:microcystin-dependent protein
MEPFIGEIRIFAGDFAPVGWALCNGQRLPIAQNTALFSILGSAYGGDGISNFGLPNLQGSAPLMAGQGQGLSQRDLGAQGGAQTVTLTTKEKPAQTHVPTCSAEAVDAESPDNAIWARDALNRKQKLYAEKASKPLLMNPDALKQAGDGQAHNNLPPYLTLTFIVALDGIFPSRT